MPRKAINNGSLRRNSYKQERTLTVNNGKIIIIEWEVKAPSNEKSIKTNQQQNLKDEYTDKKRTVELALF
jgi:predicted secreted hydrolase